MDFKFQRIWQTDRQTDRQTANFIPISNKDYFVFILAKSLCFFVFVNIDAKSIIWWDESRVHPISFHFLFDIILQQIISVYQSGVLYHPLCIDSNSFACKNRAFFWRFLLYPYCNLQWGSLVLHQINVNLIYIDCTMRMGYLCMADY